MPHWPILLCIFATFSFASTAEIGVNWGSQTSHPLNPNIVVRLLKDINISKVNLFNADQWTLSVLPGTSIDVMVGIPNDQLSMMSRHYDNTKNWVKENVARYLNDGGLKINYVVVRNEPFLTSYRGAFINSTLPTLKNIQKALDEANVSDRIKTIVPHNANVYDSTSGVPSGGSFRFDIHNLMTQIALFLQSNDAPFVVNIYPFLSLHQ